MEKELYKLKSNSLEELLLNTTGSVDMIIFNLDNSNYFLVNYCTESIDVSIVKISIDVFYYLKLEKYKTNKEVNETVVLFTDDCNGYENLNPRASLVFVTNFDYSEVKNAERNQVGANRTGGNWEEALKSLNMNYRIIENGKKLYRYKMKYNNIISCEYKVISGNY